MSKFDELNKKLQEHSNASFGNYGYNFDDPYKQALKDMRRVDKAKAEKFSNRDKKLQRTKRLLPQSKI